MAKDINLGGENPHDPKGFSEKPLAPMPTQGFGDTPLTQSPAELPPGISGQPPLPTGKVITSNLTDRERTELVNAGIDPEKPLPQNVAHLLQQAQERAQQEAWQNLPPPVPADTPPVKFDPIEIDQNDPKAMEEFHQKLQEARELEQAAEYRQEQQQQQSAPPIPPAPQPQTAQPEQPSPAQKLVDEQLQQAKALEEDQAKYANMDPSVAEAHRIAEGQQQPHEQIQVENDVQPAPAKPEPATKPETGSETGLDVQLTNCPHCSWPLHLDDPVEPDNHVKQGFLASVLGRKPFVQSFSLLGGAMQITLRTLTTPEVDMIYRQAFVESQTDLVQNDFDFFQRVNRLRIYAQLQSVRSKDGVIAELPDGVTPETNPNASAFWKGEPPEGQTLLVPIEKYILQNVLTTESLVRTAGNICARFNRLVAKMEAMIDNPDFWEAIGTSP